MQCNSIHKTIVDNFKVAIVYGKSVKHQPQRVGLSHELADEDIRESMFPHSVYLHDANVSTQSPLSRDKLQSVGNAPTTGKSNSEINALAMRDASSG
jgi:hypothetical protein